MEKIDVKIEFWQNRLLDLGKRNRLINCPISKQGGRVSRSSIAINAPTVAELWEQFSNGVKPLVFPSVVEPQNDENDSNVFSVSTGNSITNQSPKETQKTLRNLMQKAKTFTEEKGLNALYLAFGFLIWKESIDKSVEIRSPLLLVPVQLTQDDLFSPFVLSRHDDEIVPNYTLIQKLFSDFGITIPDYSDDMSLHDYIGKVSEACTSMNCVINIEVELSLFSFLKINMYQDLGKNAEEKKTSAY